MAGYIGGLATHSVLAPSDVRAAEDCKNNVCVRRWWRNKCVIPVGIVAQDADYVKREVVRVTHAVDVSNDAYGISI